MYKNLKRGFLTLAAFLTICAFLTGCTKAKLDDDFAAGAPPPVAGGYVNSRQIASSNLVGYWSFDGTVYDSVNKCCRHK